MADNFPKPQKGKQLSLEEYAKVKEKLAKEHLKVHFPLKIKALLIIPLLFLVGVLIAFLLYIRLLPEH